MVTGMMWFDDNPKKSLPGKITDAAIFYARKYGQRPNKCLVNPKALSNGDPIQVAVFTPGTETTIEIAAMQGILPGHMWIGVEVTK